MTDPSKIIEKRYRVSSKRATPFTIRLIGNAIKRSSTYIPLRNYAASLATLAAPKNYLGQLRAVWNDFVKRWRYVRDPLGTETVTTEPRAVFQLVLGHNRGVGRGRGAGDCDDATVAMGALLMSIGFPVLIGTTAPVGHARGLHFTHVFPIALVPGQGWTVVDPVLYPKRGLGAIAPHSRLAIWSLSGKILKSTGAKINRLRSYYGL